MEETEMHTVLLVDDHELIRAGLRHAAEATGRFKVIAESSTLRDGWTRAMAVKPEGAVIDVRLPDGSGLELAAKLRAAQPSLGIVILTMHAGDEALFAALEAGANAFVDKSAPAGDVTAALARAIDAPTSFSADGLAAAMRRKDRNTGPTLTEREQQVLDLLGDGYGVSQIARRLHIGESTTKTHIAKIYSKLGAGNRAQAIMTAMRMGLLAAPVRDDVA
jgi:DNA-binding NarL/FixJ family response regulator